MLIITYPQARKHIFLCDTGLAKKFCKCHWPGIIGSLRIDNSCTTAPLDCSTCLLRMPITSLTDIESKLTTFFKSNLPASWKQQDVRLFLKNFLPIRLQVFLPDKSSIYYIRDMFLTCFCFFVCFHSCNNILQPKFERTAKLCIFFEQSETGPRWLS